MSAKAALDIATLLAAVSVVLFLVVYAIRARGTWWRDPLGRILMLGALGVGALASVGTVRRIDRRIDSIDLADDLVVASTIAYLIVAIVWAYKASVVWRETHDDDDDDDPDGYPT